MQQQTDDEKDVEIAVARALEMLNTPPKGAPPAEEVLAKILSGPTPEKMLAMFLAQMIEAVQTEAMDNGLELNPIIWLTEGGAIDQIVDELQEMAGADIASMMPQVKEAIKGILQKRGAQLQEQMKQGAPAQSGQPAPQQGQAPMSNRPVMAGGM